MKKRHINRLIAALLVMVLVFLFCGCKRVDNTIAEPDEITAEYLYGEYSEQLIRDGADVTLGTIAIDTDGTGLYSISVENMVIVESDMSDAGYYIADTNISQTIPLDPEARIAYASERDAEPEVISVDELADIVNAGTFDSLEDGNEKLFDVYSISGSVVMVLAKELPGIE